MKYTDEFYAVDRSGACRKLPVDVDGKLLEPYTEIRRCEREGPHPHGPLQAMTGPQRGRPPPPPPPPRDEE